MNDTSNTAIELAKIITGFLSDISIPLIILVLLVINKNAISSFISRLTSFSFKKGDSELGMNAANPVNEIRDKKNELPSAIEKPAEQDEESDIEGKKGEGNWFSDMHKAFEEGRIEDAEASFKKYALEEDDEEKLQENKAYYLFLKFEKGKDNTSINDLEDLVRTARTEPLKFIGMQWLSFCFRDSMQYKKEIKLWENAAKEMKTQSIATDSTVYWAYALDKDDQSVKARRVLINCLSEIEDDKQKSSVFAALSRIEKSLDNKILSIYCKDKVLEYDPNNRDELFNSAYAASNEDVDEISISNYLRLIRIDANNSTALNNLGVRAQEAGLKIKAVENYKKSADHKNTLAMANQGYLLLDAGFTEEAEKIAKKAMELDDPHQNVYSLMTKIKEKREEEKAEWDKLSKKSLKCQKRIRIYTEQYYLGDSKNLGGDWFAKGCYPTSISIINDEIEATWQEPAGILDGGTYTSKLIGKVVGSTFSGQFLRKKNGDSPNTLLTIPTDTNNNCIGYLSDGGEKLKLVSTKLTEDFSLYLSKQKA